MKLRCRYSRLQLSARSVIKLQALGGWVWKIKDQTRRPQSAGTKQPKTVAKDAVTWQPQTARLRMHADTGHCLGRKTSCNSRKTCVINGHFVPHLPTRGFHRRTMTTYGRVLLSEPSTRGTWCNHPLMEAPWGFMFSLF